MRRPIHNSFGNDSTPMEPLPVRGTGLNNGAVGERRGGNPRTDAERAERHKEVIEDSSEMGEFVEMELDGMTHFRRKGFEDVEIPSVQKTSRLLTSQEQHWGKNKEKYYLKK